MLPLGVNRHVRTLLTAALGFNVPRISQISGAYSLFNSLWVIPWILNMRFGLVHYASKRNALLLGFLHALPGFGRQANQHIYWKVPSSPMLPRIISIIFHSWTIFYLSLGFLLFGPPSPFLMKAPRKSNCGPEHPWPYHFQWLNQR